MGYNVTECGKMKDYFKMLPIPCYNEAQREGPWLGKCVLIPGKWKRKLSTQLEKDMVMRSFPALMYKMALRTSDWIIGVQRGHRGLLAFHLFHPLLPWHLQCLAVHPRAASASLQARSVLRGSTDYIHPPQWDSQWDWQSAHKMRPRLWIRSSE